MAQRPGLYLSSVTLAKLLFGLGALPGGARKDRLAQPLDALLALFPGRYAGYWRDRRTRTSTPNLPASSNFESTVTSGASST